MLKVKLKEKKEKKLSNDEVRIIECRNELQTVAEAEIQASAENDKLCDSEMESDSDDILDDYLEVTQIGTVLGVERESISNDVKHRVVFIEKQISEILNRLDGQVSEGKEAIQVKGKSFQEMFAKIWLLEKENKALSDENIALKLENSEIKEKFIIRNSHENNPKNMLTQASQENYIENTTTTITADPKKTGLFKDPWQFPRQTERRQQQPISTQILYKNRFSVLADPENKSGVQIESQREKDHPWGAYADKKDTSLNNEGKEIRNTDVSWNSRKHMSKTSLSIPKTGNSYVRAVVTGGHIQQTSLWKNEGNNTRERLHNQRRSTFTF